MHAVVDALHLVEAVQHSRHGVCMSASKPAQQQHAIT